MSDPDTEVFLRLLGRFPSEAERAELTGPGLLLRLTELSEYRNRFRDSASDDGNVLASIKSWPPASRDYDLQIMLISGEGLSKCRTGIERLLPELKPRTLLTILCGEEEGETLHAEHIELVVIPGASVFELRARIPEFAKETAWIALLEDHAVPHVGWVKATLVAIAASPEDQFTFTGTVTNERSTSPWSWANFLFNFSLHWAPSAAEQLPGTVTSLVFRRDLVGRRPLPVHQFEMTILGREGPAVGAMLVDHKQSVTWWQASVHVFDNGMVAGSAVRRHHPSPRRAVFESIRWVNGGRLAGIAKTLAGHPRSAELPTGTVGRVRWIGFCHTAGFVLGALFGAGRAQHRLE